MAEWLKAADCKSVEDFLRRFKSYFLHFIIHTIKNKKVFLFKIDGLSIINNKLYIRIFEFYIQR